MSLCYDYSQTDTNKRCVRIRMALEQDFRFSYCAKIYGKENFLFLLTFSWNTKTKNKYVLN